MDNQGSESAKMAGGKTGSGRSFALVVVLVLIGSMGFGVLLKQFIRPRASTAGLIGKPAPAIKVETWLNGPGPSATDLRGKVIVVDSWAHWCGPCRAKAPELVALHKQYSPRGVVFVGLTHIEDHDPNAVKESQQFLKSAGISWPNGYGAGEALQALKADLIPQSWVIDSHNIIVWDETSGESIESAIDRALQAVP